MNSLAMLLETGELHPRSQTMQQLHPSTMCVQASLTRRTEKWITAGNTHLVCSLKAVIGKDIGHKKNNNGCERSNSHLGWRDSRSVYNSCFMQIAHEIIEFGRFWTDFMQCLTFPLNSSVQLFLSPLCPRKF